MSGNKFINFGQFVVGSVALAISVLLVFGVLQWLRLPAGNLVDWVVGAASFWWLLVIVVVPWNIYFQAREVAAQAEESLQSGISVEQKHFAYINRVERRALLAALALHFISTVALYALAWTGVSVVGYTAAVAALLLTGLRPAIRGYEYLSTRLQMIRHGMLYPREDVVELRHRLQNFEGQVEHLTEQIDMSNPHSLLATQKRYWEETHREVARLAAQQENLRATNELEHEKLARDAERAVAQISTDGQVLDHVRELVRFFKTA